MQKECGIFLVHNSYKFYTFYVSDSADFGIIINGACIWVGDDTSSHISVGCSSWKFFIKNFHESYKAFQQKGGREVELYTLNCFKKKYSNW